MPDSTENHVPGAPDDGRGERGCLAATRRPAMPSRSAERVQDCIIRAVGPSNGWPVSLLVGRSLTVSCRRSTGADAVRSVRDRWRGRRTAATAGLGRRRINDLYSGGRLFRATTTTSAVRSDHGSFVTDEWSSAAPHTAPIFPANTTATRRNKRKAQHKSILRARTRPDRRLSGTSDHVVCRPFSCSVL